MVSYHEYFGSKEDLLQHEDVEEVIDQLYNGNFKRFSRPDLNSLTHIWISVKDEDKIIGSLVAGIYPSTDCCRLDQQNFTDNKLRTCWIERIDVDPDYRGLGIGSELINRAENFFDHSNQIPKDSRSNYYVVSVHDAIPFYLKNGYQLIDTNDDSASEEIIYFTSEVGHWMAKPFKSNQLDRETLYLDLIDDEDWLDEAVFKHIPNLDQVDESLYVKYIEKQEMENESGFGLIYSLSFYASLEELKKVYDRLVNIIGKPADGELFLDPKASKDIHDWVQSINYD